jgi:hypothetical protein
MHDEFDDRLPAQPAAARADPAGSQRRRIARLAGRLYANAPPWLRPRLVQRLLVPLGTLAVAGVAGGAFGRWLHDGSLDGLARPLAELDRLSGQPMIELASFVEQVSPQALADFARLLAEQPLGSAAFSVGAAWLLLRLLRPEQPPHPPRS